MDRNQIKEDMNNLLDSSIAVHDIMNINHSPHPYTIGTRHIDHASTNYSGSLGEETMKAVKCAHPKCCLSYEEHTYNTVCVMKLNDNLSTSVVQELLKKILPIMEKRYRRIYIS